MPQSNLLFSKIALAAVWKVVIGRRERKQRKLQVLQIVYGKDDVT